MTACTWCQQPFTPRQPTARFCCTSHRLRFHEACRRHGEREFEAGRVTINQLRGAASAPVHGSGDA